MIAVIGDGGNTGSIALHERLGFRRVGTLEAVGFKLGRCVDTVLIQRALGAPQHLMTPLTREKHSIACWSKRSSNQADN